LKLKSSIKNNEDIGRKQKLLKYIEISFREALVCLLLSIALGHSKEKQLKAPHVLAAA
jgi:hypothetical protein